MVMVVKHKRFKVVVGVPWPMVLGLRVILLLQMVDKVSHHFIDLPVYVLANQTKYTLLCLDHSHLLQHDEHGGLQQHVAQQLLHHGDVL